jgi:hypothetical protein
LQPVHYQRRNARAETALRLRAGARSPRRSPSVCGTPTDVGSSVITLATAAALQLSAHSFLWRSLCRGLLRFQGVRVLDHKLQTINPISVRHHPRHHPLETRWSAAPHNHNSWSPHKSRGHARDARASNRARSPGGLALDRLALPLFDAP